jgi:hypothetical protein
MNEKAVRMYAYPFPDMTVATVQPASGLTFHIATAKTTTCTDPKVAQLVKWLGYRFLVESLQFAEEIFEIVFHTRPPSFIERQQLLEHVQAHVTQCIHCQIIDQQVVEEERLLDEELRLVKSWLNQSTSAIVDPETEESGG